MMKEQLHKAYVEALNEKHESYTVPLTRRAAIVGVSPGNIGEAIAEKLWAEEEWDSVAGTNKKSHDCAYYDIAVDFLLAAGEAGPLDTLVVCAASTHLDWIENYPVGRLVDVIHDSLIAPMVVTQAFVRMTMAYPCVKHIVYVGSMAYTRVLNASSVYCAAKAGLAHFARCMAWELGPKAYRVFIVHPGNVRNTPMTQETIDGIARYRDIDPLDAVDYWSSSEPPMGFLSKADVAQIVKDLLDGRWEHAAASQIELAGGIR